MKQKRFMSKKLVKQIQKESNNPLYEPVYKGMFENCLTEKEMKKKNKLEDMKNDLGIFYKQKFAVLDAIELIKVMTMKYHLERFKNMDENKISYVEIYDDLSVDMNAKNSVINGLKIVSTNIELKINILKAKIDIEENGK